MIYNTIILSFVVQNFQSPHFLIKTQRYKYLKSLHFSLNLFIFSKMRLTQSFTPFLNSLISPHLISLYKRFFEKKFCQIKFRIEGSIRNEKTSRIRAKLN